MNNKPRIDTAYFAMDLPSRKAVLAIMEAWAKAFPYKKPVELRLVPNKPK